jgi:hypothetical protein
MNAILKNMFLSVLNSQFLKRVVVGLAIVVAILQLSILLPKTLGRTDKMRDVYAYYLVKERIEHGRPIYLNLSKKGPHDSSLALYLYPPVFAGVLSLLPKMSFLTFARLWTLLLYGAFWIYATTLGKLAFGRFSLSSTLSAGLILFFFPGTFRALALGQIDPLLWAFFGLALSMPLFRGGFTMLVAIIKPWGIWPFLWSIGEGLRVWAGAITVLLGSALVGALAFGGEAFVENCRTWFTHILPSLAQGAWSPDNRSLSFALLRGAHSVGLWSYDGGALPLGARIWLLGSGLAGPLLIGWRFRRSSKNLQLAAVGCTAILVSPICWTTYLPALLTLAATAFHSKIHEAKEARLSTLTK